MRLIPDCRFVIVFAAILNLLFVLVYSFQILLSLNAGSVTFTVASTVAFLRNDGHTFKNVPLSYNGILYIFANVVFIIGCVCFMPRYDEDNDDVLVAGISLFTIGSLIFTLAPTWNICRTIELGKEKKINSISYRTEISVGVAYILGSTLFVVGSVLYLPRYYDDNAEAAVGCFIWGSACFLLATMITSIVHFVLSARKIMLKSNTEQKLSQSNDNSKITDSSLGRNFLSDTERSDVQ